MHFEWELRARVDGAMLEAKFAGAKEDSVGLKEKAITLSGEATTLSGGEIKKVEDPPKIVDFDEVNKECFLEDGVSFVEDSASLSASFRSELVPQRGDFWQQGKRGGMGFRQQGKHGSRGGRSSCHGGRFPGEMAPASMGSSVVFPAKFTKNGGGSSTSSSFVGGKFKMGLDKRVNLNSGHMAQEDNYPLIAREDKAKQDVGPSCNISSPHSRACDGNNANVDPCPFVKGINCPEVLQPLSMGVRAGCLDTSNGQPSRGFPNGVGQPHKKERYLEMSSGGPKVRIQIGEEVTCHKGVVSQTKWQLGINCSLPNGLIATSPDSRDDPLDNSLQGYGANENVGVWGCSK